MPPVSSSPAVGPVHAAAPGALVGAVWQAPESQGVWGKSTESGLDPGL